MGHFNCIFTHVLVCKMVRNAMGVYVPPRKSYSKSYDRVSQGSNMISLIYLKLLMSKGLKTYQSCISCADAQCENVALTIQYFGMRPGLLSVVDMRCRHA